VDTEDLLVRLGLVEYRMKALQDEVAEIRAALQSDGEAVPVRAQPLRVTPPPATAREPFPTRPAPAAPVPAAPAATQSAPAAAPTVGPRSPFPSRPAQPAPAYDSAPPRPPRDWDLSDLPGPQVLAWAGGIVTLLGVIFFFILAANHGWIGPGVRVLCGAVASAIVFFAGLWLRRRFGETHSAPGSRAPTRPSPLPPRSTTSSRARSHSSSPRRSRPPPSRSRSRGGPSSSQLSA
jgi:uncharacterized membrane protein